MRPIKRFLVFAAELGVFLAGVVLSFVAVVAVGWNGNPFTPSIFWLGLLITMAGFFVFRRKTWPWKIRYDAVGWELERAKRKLHPTRAQYKRTARRILIWLPPDDCEIPRYRYAIVC